MKNMIRKVAAVGAGAGMLLSTLGGALAADLGDLPAPFVANGAYVNTAFVVGASAGTNDDAARTKLVSYFGSSVTASEDFTYSSDDDSDDDITLEGSDNLAGFSEVDSGMIDTLFEGEIEVNNVDYTAREIINFSADTNLSTSFRGGQEEMGDEPYLTYYDGSVNYGYAFSDAIPCTAVTTDDTLDLDFLGKSIEIKNVSCTAASDQVILDVAETVSLNTGETTEYKGHTVKLVRVYTSSAAIDVDGEEKIIGEENQKDFGDDIQVEVEVVGESDDPTLSSAVLKLSEQGVASTVGRNDQFELFTDYDTNSHSPWVWEIEVDASGNLTYLGIDNRWDTDDLEPSQSYKSLPITVGESIVFPNNYATLVFDSLTTEVYADFEVIIDDSRDLSDDDDSTISVNDMPMVVFTSSTGEYFELGGSDYHTVYMVNNGTDTLEDIQYWGEDDDGTHYTTGGAFVINYNDDDSSIDVSNTTTNNVSAQITVDATDWDMTFNWTYAYDYFGADEGEDEATDVIVDSTNLGTREYDVLLQDGTIIRDPNVNFGTDKLVFAIPDQDVEATFRVYTVASSSDVEAVLKADSAATGYDNLILVGGPCVNTLTASFMGLTYPACEAASTIAQDKAVVKMLSMDGKMALVVAGWEQADTLRAANKVAAGGLSGDSLIVE
jgi:hypothetical protein